MKRRVLPSADYLRSRFLYSGESGLLVWKPVPERKHQDKAWNKKWAGKEAGWISVWGYRIVGIARIEFNASRLMWKLVTGEEPPPIIDHINGNPLDNRFSNLRAATDAQNAANVGARKRNTSGHVGVYRYRDGRWMVSLNFRCKRYFGGYHKTFEEAVAARIKLAEEIHGDFAGHKCRPSEQAARMAAA